MIPYRLIIGTANWFSEYNKTFVNQKQAEKIIDYALSNGIKEFDTARSYAQGKAEEYLAGIDGIHVYTKGDSLEEYNRSKELLKDKMIGYLIHHPTLNYKKYKNIKESVDCSFGISSYDIRESKLFREKVGAEIIQLPFHELWNNRETYFDNAIIIRKIFRYKDNMRNQTIEQSLNDILEINDKWDRAVVGVDNVDQLKEIIEIWKDL